MAVWVDDNQHHCQSDNPTIGDARMDSPGFCAQYCTYSTMENETKHIISMVNIDKRETMRNSVVMEKEAFQQTFEALRQEINLTEICTNAHSQISALFNKGKYRDSGVHHTLDVWHGSKNLSKKIHAAGQQKGCAILQMWNKDICNHFWYCCKTADTYEEFIDMCVGVLHHVTGEHTWALGECKHGPLLDDRDKELIESGSVAHERLAEIILDERWLKVVPKYLNFRSTADLESFHNHILMYASKRFSFSPPVYAACTMLAGLDYNHHLHRPARRKADGTIQSIAAETMNNLHRTIADVMLRPKSDPSTSQDTSGNPMSYVLLLIVLMFFIFVIIVSSFSNTEIKK
ncbi:uncharacterized protein LOC127943302 [Carassius gibelio]|uniref:uncharacterized protein LOC127943302 n=1 Tax=Carassius gibelio TaxID=101364 RepID=UPI0022793B2B|nr:uncharacterized protein LOC127943302 [Carassius gibelio]